MKLKNCSNCGAVFAQNVSDLCPQCYRDEEAAYQTVYRFLNQRKNREATIPQIVAATEVEEKTIIKFLKQKRLRTSQFPSLAYPCETCGEAILEGKLCQHCSKKIIGEWSQTSEEMAQQSDEKGKSVFYTMNNKINKDRNR